MTPEQQLRIVRAELSKLSPDVAGDDTLRELIAAGSFADLLAQQAKPVPHARLAKSQHAVDQREQHELRRQLDAANRERQQLVRRLSESDQLVSELRQQLTDQRQVFRTRIRRSRAATQGQSDTNRLLVVIAELIGELRHRRVSKEVRRGPDGLISTVVETTE
jgi:predicted RNase H-like nuclease (RuvC/YqgF family)